MGNGAMNRKGVPETTKKIEEAEETVTREDAAVLPKQEEMTPHRNGGCGQEEVHGCA